MSCVAAVVFPQFNEEEIAEDRRVLFCHELSMGMEPCYLTTATRLPYLALYCGTHARWSGRDLSPVIKDLTFYE